MLMTSSPNPPEIDASWFYGGHFNDIIDGFQSFCHQYWRIKDKSKVDDISDKKWWLWYKWDFYSYKKISRLIINNWSWNIKWIFIIVIINALF